MRTPKPEHTITLHKGKKYFLIKDRGRWKLLHHYVWELYNGPVPEGYNVHHKNENTLCNCIPNLELLTRADHSRLHNTGKHFTEQSKRKLSEAHKGVRISEGTKLKMSAAAQGRVVSEETRAKLAVSTKNAWETGRRKR